jgi:predicted thioesterase
MIMKLEETAVHAVKVHLPEGKATVGFHVNVKHIAPARQGALITTIARLIAVDGAKLTFEVEAREGERLIGVGTHRRAVIDVT